MWSVILTTYNLPSWLCMKESSLMLTLLIPGPKSPGKDIDVYLRPLIDDLKDLWALKGVETIDVATGQTFNMRAILLWTVVCLDGVGSPEIDTYQANFKSEFPNQDMKEEFHGWFGSQTRQRYIDIDPGVSVSDELFALACRPTSSPVSVNSCIDNGVRFVVHSRDVRRTTQNSDICLPGEKDGEMYYGQLEEILEFLYMSFKVVLFRSFKYDQYILATQVKQVFYLEDMARRPPNWKVVQDVNHKKFLNESVIVVEGDHDVLHFNNSSDLALSTSLNNLDFTTLNMDSQSTDVDAPPDIIDVDEDDDFIDDEDILPHDLADSDDEVLSNDDDDDADDDDDMSADVARGHDGVAGGDDRPPSRQIFTGCQGEAENPIGEAGKPEN
ncbi:RNA-directed DNA polymerase, eukaryota [Tanacetum coccineum]